MADFGKIKNFRFQFLDLKCAIIQKSADGILKYFYWASRVTD